MLVKASNCCILLLNSICQVVHGDLATRNVLLTSHRVAKICDFGLAKDLYEYNMIRKMKKDEVFKRRSKLLTCSYLLVSYYLALF
jgi:serine/threonine protein kinase